MALPLGVPMKPDTAYMEVPRCEATIITHGDFGCVQWEAKS